MDIKEKIEPEVYDEYGQIVKVEARKPYTRVMNTYNLHRIHETKDLIDTNCSMCQKTLDKQQEKWEKKNA